MSNYTKIITVHKSREILLNILKERGFETDDYSGFSIDEIHTMFENKQLDILLNNENNKKIYIKYYLEKTIRPTNVHDMIEDLFNIEAILTKKDDLIIIIKDEPNDTLQKLQRSILEHEQIYVTIININRLQFNVLKHSLVPKHRVLTEKESEIFKQKFNISSNRDIPAISRFETISQVLGIRPGDFVEIERSSKTSIISYYYRICSQ
jgi:DNA-directed RNA polymerase subunit H